MLKLTNRQFQSVRTLVKDECANYMQGKCIPLGVSCPQLNCKTGLCSYFKKSVLPLDYYLYSEIVKDGENFTKRCEKCGNTFQSKAQNTRFCSECAKKQRLITYRNSKRKLRGYMSTK